MAADLDKLKEEIAVLGDQIKTLKAEKPDDKAAIGAAVQALLAAKKNYAASNNGIGVDGKPFEEGGGKKSKKKEDKGPPKEVRAVFSLCCWYI